MTTSKSCCFIQDKIINICKQYQRLEVSRAVLLQRIWKKFVRNNGARVRPLFWHLLLPKRAKQATCTLITVWMLERFSFECRKVIGFALSTRCDWLKRFAPPFHPIRSKTKANCDALACIFPRFASATCNYFEFRLVQCIVCVLCDWPE